MDIIGKSLTKKLLIKEEEFQHTFDFERKQISDYLSGFLDIRIFKENNIILAGGSLLSCLTGKSHEINDWDLFCPTEESYNTLTSHLISKKCDRRFTSKYAITWNKGSVVLQSIYNKNLEFTTPEELINKFDFTICQVAYDFNKDKFTFGTRFWTDLVKKQIVVSTLDNPVSCLFRIKKYEKKNYKINKTEHLKVIMAVSMLQVNTVKDLQEHFEKFYLVNISEIKALDPEETITIDKLLSILDLHCEKRNIVQKTFVNSVLIDDDLPF